MFQISRVHGTLNSIWKDDVQFLNLPHARTRTLTHTLSLTLSHSLTHSLKPLSKASLKNFDGHRFDVIYNLKRN